MLAVFVSIKKKKVYILGKFNDGNFDDSYLWRKKIEKKIRGKLPSYFDSNVFPNLQSGASINLFRMWF